MLDFNFGIRWPNSARFANLKTWHGSTPFVNKYWEFQFCKTADILSLEFSFTTRTEADHAGLKLGLGLFGFAADLTFYDSRHRIDTSREPTLWQVKFCILDIESGQYIDARTEVCYSVFEAEQLVADEGSRYDKCFIKGVRE